MKSLLITLLVTLIFSACAQVNKIGKFEHRAVGLPKTDPRTSHSNCQSIVDKLIAGGLPERLRDKFPQLTDAQMKGLFMNCNWTPKEYQFQTDKKVEIVTGINYQGDLSQAKDIADFLESEAKKAVESYFAKPTSQSLTR